MRLPFLEWAVPRCVGSVEMSETVGVEGIGWTLCVGVGGGLVVSVCLVIGCRGTKAAFSRASCCCCPRNTHYVYASKCLGFLARKWKDAGPLACWLLIAVMIISRDFAISISRRRAGKALDRPSPAVGSLAISGCLGGLLWFLLRPFSRISLSLSHHHHHHRHRTRPPI